MFCIRYCIVKISSCN